MGRVSGYFEDPTPPAQETCVISMMLLQDAEGFVEADSFDGFLNGVPASFFLASNSSHSFVTAQAMQRAGLHFSSTTPKRCQQFYFGSNMTTLGTVVSPFRIQDYTVDAFEFEVLPSIQAFDVVLGGNWIRPYGQLSYSRDGIAFPQNGRTISLRHSPNRRRRVTD